jgi:putative hydrolase of the HAD superfamily
VQGDIRGIIFDAGGTLIEGGMPWYEVYQQALTLAAAAMPARRMVARYEAAVARMVADKQAAVETELGKLPTLSHYLSQAFEVSERRLRAAVDEVLFDHPEARHLVAADGVHQALSGLAARGYRLGVISNWSADLPRTLERLDLKRYFAGIFASESLGHAKPSAAAFLVPLGRLGLTPGESVYVGDLYHVDVLGSREVGMTPVLVDPLRLGLHDDVTTIGGLAELLTLLPGTGA